MYVSAETASVDVPCTTLGAPPYVQVPATNEMVTCEPAVMPEPEMTVAVRPDLRARRLPLERQRGAGSP